jgi:hypothetical protein
VFKKTGRWHGSAVKVAHLFQNVLLAKALFARPDKIFGNFHTRMPG